MSAPRPLPRPDLAMRLRVSEQPRERKPQLPRRCGCASTPEHFLTITARLDGYYGWYKVARVNRLYFGDNLEWLRDRREFPDASVDLVRVCTGEFSCSKIAPSRARDTT